MSRTWEPTEAAPPLKGIVCHEEDSSQCVLSTSCPVAPGEMVLVMLRDLSVLSSGEAPEVYLPRGWTPDSEERFVLARARQEGFRITPMEAIDASTAQRMAEASLHHAEALRQYLKTRKGGKG